MASQTAKLQRPEDQLGGHSRQKAKGVSKTHQPEVYKSRPISKLQNYIQASHENYNEQRIYATCAPKKTLCNPYTYETLYQMHKEKERGELENPVFSSGITPGQWKSINEFQIVGQSHRKKHNYHVAIEHYFNLRAMYRRINEIKFKKSMVSENSTSVSMHKQSQPASSKPVAKITRPLTSKMTQIHHNKLHKPQMSYEEIRNEPQTEHKAIKRRAVDTPVFKSAATKKSAPPTPSDLNEHEMKEKPKKKKKAVNKKKKIKAKKPKEEPNHRPPQNAIGDFKPLSNSKSKRLGADDFKNTNEQELIRENLGLIKKGKREVDLDEFGVEQRISHPKESKGIHEAVSGKTELIEDPMQKYGDFLHKAKANDSDQKTRKPELNMNPPLLIKTADNGRRSVGLTEAVDKPYKNANVQNQPVKSSSENNFFNKDKPIKEIGEDEEEEVYNSDDSENFELTNFPDKIKRAEPEDDELEPDADDDIMNKIPVLESEAEDHILDFKQKLVEMIFNYEIFNQEEFDNFYEAVCLKNQGHNPELIEAIFVQVKDYLYEQFQALAEEEEEGEPGVDEQEEEDDLR